MRYWISVVVSFAFAFVVLSPYAQCSYVCSIKAFILWQSIGVFFLLCCLVSWHCLELTCIGAKHVLCTKSIMHTHTHIQHTYPLTEPSRTPINMAAGVVFSIRAAMRTIYTPCDSYRAHRNELQNKQQAQSA